MDFGSLFGGIGSIAGAFINANATANATRAQVNALNQQRQFVWDNLNPSTVNAAATAADVQNANARLRLQQQIDPALYGLRYQAENALPGQLANLGVPGQAVAGQATAEALTGVPGMQEGKSDLVAKALEQLKLGATLPPDVQNELVQAGLERTGSVTGAASGQGVGGQVLRTILGSAGLQLQQQRQQSAVQMLNSASGLESQRQQILQQLFPSLTNTQLQVMGGTTGALSASNAMQPNAGLTGSQIANTMMARVGAANQVGMSAADTAARGAMATGQIWGNALGGGLGSLGRSGILGGGNSLTDTQQAVLDSISGGVQTRPSG
jgi:hypothetical protein